MGARDLVAIGSTLHREECPAEDIVRCMESLDSASEATEAAALHAVDALSAESA